MSSKEEILSLHWNATSMQVCTGPIREPNLSS